MKKIIFIILILTVFLSGCSKEKKPQSESVYKRALDGAKDIKENNEEKNDFERTILGE